jgi:hypothetical protein
MEKKRQPPTRLRIATKHRSIPLSKLPKRSYAARNRALHVLADMRANPTLSLAQAAKREGVKPQTVTKYFGSALRKSDGQFEVRKTDRFTAVLSVPSAEGKLISVKTRSSKVRTVLGRYLRDIGRYLGGDVDAIARWRGKTIAGVQLVTDERTILDMEPILEDFSLYRAIQ